MKYAQLPLYSIEEIVKAINENDITKLEIIPLSVGEYCDKYSNSIEICLELSQHNDPKIRANSLLGISYIARTTRCLNKKNIFPILKREYKENLEYRGIICDAIDDIIIFMKWKRPRWYYNKKSLKID